MVIYSGNILKWLICLFKDSFTIYFCIIIHLALVFPSCHWKIDPSLLGLERPEDRQNTQAERDKVGLPDGVVLALAGVMTTATEPYS